MNKIKIKFMDVEIELEADSEDMEAVSNRALNGITYLVSERLKIKDDEPEAEDMPREQPPQPVRPLSDPLVSNIYQ